MSRSRRYSIPDGNDTIDGGADHDRLYGGSGNDTIADSNGNNRIYGDSGDDVIIMGGGHDQIIGSIGDDLITGGGGRDTFIFQDGFGNDVITDFAVHETTERLNLSAVSEIVDWIDLSTNHLSSAGGNTVISDGLGNTITLNGVGIDALTADEFIF